MAGKLFYEILEEQLRSELRKELEAEIRAELEARPRTSPTADQSELLKHEGARGRIETWLATNVKQTTFAARRPGFQGYRIETARPKAQYVAQPKAEKEPELKIEPRYQATSIEDLCRLELLRRNGARIADAFTEHELKTAWRKAALKTHPDRFAQADHATQLRMSALFRELAEAYDVLSMRLASAHQDVQQTTDAREAARKAA